MTLIKEIGQLEIFENVDVHLMEEKRLLLEYLKRKTNGRPCCKIKS
jgi:hypothetical protein